MNSRLKIFISFFLLSIYIISIGQERDVKVNINWDNERHAWSSFWIAHPTESPFEYGVYLFRKSFSLSEVPDKLTIYVSADNRYRLFVNEKEVSMGPARGSFMYWRYETIDISKYLKEGNNIIAAEVFNLGEHIPDAQFSRRTAFILQAEVPDENMLNTGKTEWKVIRDRAYHVRPVTGKMVDKYYVAGPCDSIVGEKYLWNWNTLDFNDDSWQISKRVSMGAGRGYMHGKEWLLVPRNIPQLEQEIVRFDKVARTSLTNIEMGFIKGNTPLIIPANTKCKILLDIGKLTVGYPEILLSKGGGSKLVVVYSEAMYNADGTKGNRNIIEGKVIKGYSDIFMPEGGVNKLYRPIWQRTFRYVQLEIETGNEELIVNDYYGVQTIYPLKENASFNSNNPLLGQIWKTGWLTARLCAGETYVDCPYYEQLQYIGDTRIQSLISLYVSGDDRLMRNALEQINNSRIPDGLTMGRAPSAIPQIAPPFSLYWVDMVHDYYMHRTDDEFIKQFLPGIQSVLGWFERRIDDNNMVGGLDWFNFSDWTTGFMVGAPAGVDTSNSALLSLNFVYALERASELFGYFDFEYEASKYKNMANDIRKAVYINCFNEEKGLLKDTPYEESYSQHTNIFGILTNTFPKKIEKEVMKRIMIEQELIQTTIYYKFYLFRAMQKSGMAELYINQLDPWKEMLDKGLTTWEEGDYDERSDCHAWGAHPNYDMLATICGILPASPGFKTVLIKPAMGDLKFIEGKIPHPYGVIKVKLTKYKKNGVKGEVELPENITGKFIWNRTEIELTGGKQEIIILSDWNNYKTNDNK